MCVCLWGGSSCEGKIFDKEEEENFLKFFFVLFSEQKIRSDTVGHFRHVDVKPKKKKKKKKQLFSPSPSSSFVLLEPTSEAIALSG